LSGPCFHGYFLLHMPVLYDPRESLRVFALAHIPSPETLARESLGGLGLPKFHHTFPMGMWFAATLVFAASLRPVELLALPGTGLNSENFPQPTGTFTP